MPGFCRSYAKGDSIYVNEGGNSYIRITIIDFQGSRRNRSARIYIDDNGLEERFLTLTNKRDNFIIEGIWGKIAPNTKPPSGKVSITFNFWDDYIITHNKKYKSSV